MQASNQLVFQGKAFAHALGQTIQPGGQARQGLLAAGRGRIVGIEGQYQLGRPLQALKQHGGDFQGLMITESTGLFAELRVYLEMAGTDVIHQQFTKMIDQFLADGLQFSVTGILELNVANQQLTSLIQPFVDQLMYATPPFPGGSALFQHDEPPSLVKPLGMPSRSCREHEATDSP